MLDEMEEEVVDDDPSMLEEEVNNMTRLNLSLPCGLLITTESIATVQVSSSGLMYIAKMIGQHR